MHWHRWPVSCLPLLLAGCVLCSPAAAAPIWIEAENYQRTNFWPGAATMVGDRALGASGGKYLRLYVEKAQIQSPVEPFYVEYRFRVPRDGNYQIWLGASPQTESWASPFSLALDNQPAASLQGRPSVGTPWGDPATQQQYFSWFAAGSYRLKAGDHRLRLEVPNPRTADNQLYAAFIDTLVISDKAKFVPTGNTPPATVARAARQREQIEQEVYRLRLGSSNEAAGGLSAEQVRRRILARPLQANRDPRFGLHGVEAPFTANAGGAAGLTRIYALLARAGVARLRTSEAAWHRLGANLDRLADLDAQAANARRFGIKLQMVIGYPPKQFNLADSELSTFAPQHEERFRAYLRLLLSRYRDVIASLEVGNEVDAPEVWWKGAGPAEYVRDCRIVREELQRAGLTVPVVAFGGVTASREAGTDFGRKGRRFVEAALAAGLDRYVDQYALHYTWAMSQQPFVIYMRDQLRRQGSRRPLVNSEDAGYGHPSEILKVFARNFYYYEMPAVYYFVARDFAEGENLLLSGLFDADWQPKSRLLAYAAAVDAMAHRPLLGIARPAAGLEAYVLGKASGGPAGQAPYSIVLWKNDPQVGEQTGPGFAPRRSASALPVSGLRAIRSARDWKGDPLRFDRRTSRITVGVDPVVVFTSSPPNWPLRRTARLSGG